MKIQVTQRHIDNGIPESCRKCAVALALLDAGFDNAYVNRHDVVVWKNGIAVVYPAPQSVMSFVRRYDDDNKRDKVKPFNFILKESALAGCIKIKP